MGQLSMLTESLNNMVLEMNKFFPKSYYSAAAVPLK